MALTIKLATRYWLKTIIMTIVCIVLGVWGVWDYSVKIPQAERAVSRATLLRIVNAGLITQQGSKDRSEAFTAINDAIEKDDPQDDAWSDELETLKDAVFGGDLKSQRIAIAIVEDRLQEYGSVIKPGKFDRPMQWLFISCLPFGLYYFWGYWKMNHKASLYKLNDDGTLFTPDKTWGANEIADIDMSRWIAKTGNARSTWIATLIMKDGTKVVLDDYVYKDMHLFIGKFAHQFYPDQWTPIAKRVKVESTQTTNEEE